MDAWVPFLTSLVWPAFIIVFLFIARQWVEEIIRVLRKRIESGAGVSMKMGAGEFTIKQAVEEMAEKQDELVEQHQEIEEKANTTESTLNSLTSLMIAPPFESSFYGGYVDRRIDDDRVLIIGCRKLTEQRILCALLTVLLRREDYFREVIPKYDYGGAIESFIGLARGDIDIYSEYTWTGFELAFDRYLSRASPSLSRLSPEDSIAELNRIYGTSPYAISWICNLGFQNNWEIIMRAELAARKGIDSLSDLRKFPDEFVLGCEREFFKRTEAFGVLTRPAPEGYNIDFRDIKFFPRREIYHALDEGEVDIIDGFTTDPQVNVPDYRKLRDDNYRFGKYNAAVVARTRLLERVPLVESVVESLSDHITSEEMGRMVQEANTIQHDDEMKNYAIEGIAERYLDQKKIGALGRYPQE